MCTVLCAFTFAKKEVSGKPIKRAKILIRPQTKMFSYIAYDRVSIQDKKKVTQCVKSFVLVVIIITISIIISSRNSSQ